MTHVGILGGTFDIVHNGHLEVASVVAKKIGLNKVFLVTAGNPPHKSGVLDGECRHELVVAALEGRPELEASRIELDLPGISYTHRTISELKAQLSAQAGHEVKISFILSAEYLDPTNPSNISTWEEAEAMLAMVQLVVVPRGPYTPELARQWAGELRLTNFLILDKDISHLSSGIVRDALRKGLPIESLVPARVAALVKERGIVYQ